MDDFTRTWPLRLEWLRKGFGIVIAGDPPFQAFDVAVEWRNAIIHGDGQLTDLQTRRLSKLLVLRKRMWDILRVQKPVPALAGAPPLILSLALCNDVARSMVAAFDELVIAKYPEAASI